MTQRTSLSSKNKSQFLKKAFKGLSSEKTDKNNTEKSMTVSTKETK